MSQEHLTDQQVEAYRRRNLDASAGRALASHLATCESCLRRVVDTAHVGAALASLKESFLSFPDEEPFHLSAEELKRYADGQGDQADQTIFESHLEDCAECNRLAQDLILVNPASTVRENVSEPGSGTIKHWPRLRDFWRQSPFLRPIYLGGIAIVILCATLVVLLVRSTDSNVGVQLPPQSASNGTKDSPGLTPLENQPGEEIGGSTGQNNERGPDTDQTPSNFPPPSERPTETIVSLVDGSGEVTLDKRGELSGLGGISKPIQTAVRHALSTKEIEKPRVLDELVSPRITLLGQTSDSTPIALLAPLGVVSLDDRPAFKWQPLSGATDYTVSVFDSNFNRISRGRPQKANNWTVPTSLRRGRIYFWEVSALKDGREITSPVAPAPRAQFRIVDEKSAGEITQVKNSRPNSHLVLGILYARAGLLDEAEREFELLVDANPSSEIAGRFLRRVRSWKNR